MRLTTILIAVSYLLAGSVHATAASLDGLAVEVTNRSEPVLCAEKDNVAIAFASPQVRSFRLEAAHPAYIGTLQRDSFEADWTACDMSADPAFKSEVKEPVRRTIWESPGMWLVGWTLPTFWRPAATTFRVGDRVEKGLHLVQLWMIRPNGGEEVLVVYPQDGYWRIRPMAPAGLQTTAFGSSFLVGPVEQDGRPVVNLTEIAFVPETRSFTLAFKGGGRGEVRLVTVDQRINALDVVLERPVEGRPFAMLRSMYVTGFNNDAAEIAVRARGAKGWREAPVMDFDKASASDVWIGRRTPSQHNTSSPDHVLSSFSATEKPARPRSEAPPR